MSFYGELLQLEPDTTVPSRVYLHCGEAIVVLVDVAVEDPGAEFRTNPDDVYFATDDLDGALRRATKSGTTIRSGIATQPWGERSFYLDDPDGNPLCVVDETTLFLGRGADWA